MEEKEALRIESELEEVGEIETTAEEAREFIAWAIIWTAERDDYSRKEKQETIKELCGDYASIDSYASTDGDRVKIIICEMAGDGLKIEGVK